MSQKTFYVTTPLYYANAEPHIGHAYASIGADVQARYQRANGREVYFLTGTDEHGQKIEKAAKEKGFASPKALADDVVQKSEALWKLLDISYSRFFRTTDADHKKAAEKFWSLVQSKGFIEKRKYSGWYCVHEETFWPEAQLIEPGHLCPDCKRPTSQSEEENYFFRQTAFAAQLKDWVLAHPDFIAPEIRRNEILGSYLNAKEGVLDQSISRGNVNWGLKVPGDDSQVIYVWFDALLNYITAAGWESDPARFAKTWPADVHIIGKDILRFHALLWPAMLMAADIEPPKKVFGTGLILNDGIKMSKSLNNFIDPTDWATRFGVDTFRYYLMRELPFGSDGSVSEAGIQSKYNTELANDIGNLLSRTLSMLEKYFGAKIPEATVAVDDPLRHECGKFWPAYKASMDALSYHEAIECILVVARRANKYIDDKAPWKLAKDESKKAELAACLVALTESLRIISYALSPFMPAVARKMLLQLGLDGALKNDGSLALGTLEGACSVSGLKAGHLTAKGEPLFPRSEPAAAAK